MWASNVFPGSSVILEFKAPANEIQLNFIHIQKILYGIKPQTNSPANKDSLTGPGFGYSSSCNVNITCISGWSQEQQGVAQVIDENGGWCSAFLVMNTCNTTRPYVMTANHCILHNGNPVNTNNSTFEFLWYSSTCSPTTNTTSTLLFNGATIRARWAETDFALMELNQAISSTAGLSFLGWSRSSTQPNSSVGIHHPLGDIMKGSIENDVASVGHIGTYQNNAWRVRWDVGTVQGGSSGSPLFDQTTHKVIGQLYSNTQPAQPPCNQNSGGTNYGRFDVSWDGGGTTATRLKDWLDPTNTNVSSTNTTSASSLAAYNLQDVSIVGDNFICSGSKTYSISSNPTGLSVTWSASNGYVTVSGSGNSVTVTATNGASGLVTLTATIGSSSCQANNIKTLVINVGGPSVTFSVTGHPSSPPTCYEVWGINSFQAEQITGSPGSFTGYSWGWRNLTNSTVSTDPTIYGSSYTVIPETAGTYEIWVKPTNSCGAGPTESVLTINVVESCWGGFMMSAPTENSLSVYPNPTRNTSKIKVTKEFKKDAILYVSDQFGVLLFSRKIANNAEFVDVDLSKYEKGFYQVTIRAGKISAHGKIIKQ